MLLDINLTKIAGLIARAVDTTLTNNNEFLRYNSILTSRCSVGGIAEVSNKLIEFQVGMVDTTGGILQTDPNHCAVMCDVVLPDSLRDEVRVYANKDNALSGDFHSFDHSATIALLARAIAKYRFTGSLVIDDLTGGKDLAYEALRAQTRQVAAMGNATVLPAGADSMGSPNVTAALVGAISGLDGTVYSHVVGVNAETNCAKIPVSENEELALGCYDALNILAMQYDACGAGEVFAWAHTVGLMQGATVVSGTDEGGVLRDIMRTVRFGVPYGPISININSPAPLPSPRVANGFTKYVDGTVLQCAGAVAICDPLVMVDGDMYATTLASSYEYSNVEALHEANRLTDADEDPNEGRDGDALSLIKKMQNSFPSFMALYSKALGRIYGLQGGSSTVVKSGVATIGSMIGRTNRHLKYKVVNPYFWIEPTGSTRFDVSDFPVTREGIGRLAAFGENGTRPAFCDVTEVGDNGFSTAYKIKWKCARRHGMLQHLTAHQEDGLAHIMPRQVNSNKITGLGVGANGREDESLTEKLNQGRGMDEYLWRRGTSSVIGPAEVMTPGAKMGLVVQYRDVSGGGLRVTSLHSPTPQEMTQSVVFEVSGLAAVNVTVRGPGPTVRSRRQRDLAARALDSARNVEKRLVDLDILMPISTNDEDFDDDKPAEGGEMETKRVVVVPPTVSEGGKEVVDGAKLKTSTSHGTVTAPNIKTGRAQTPTTPAAATGGAVLPVGT